MTTETMTAEETTTDEWVGEPMPTVPMDTKVFHAIRGVFYHTSKERTEDRKRREAKVKLLEGKAKLEKLEEDEVQWLKGEHKTLEQEAEWLARDRAIVEAWIEQTMRLPQHLRAELLFYDPNKGSAGELAEGLIELKEAGIAAKVLPGRKDPYSDCVWVQVDEVTDIGEAAWCEWLEDIITPYDGEVLEAGLA